MGRHFMLDYFFNPKGVAVIGASIDRTKGGFFLLRNALVGYKGKLFPVNPKYNEIQGVQCYPDIRSIPENFDLALYFIPAKFLPDTIRECARKGVKAIIIESSGFSEVGKEGERLQTESLALARQYGIRLWGPNCMGYLDGHSMYAFSFMRIEGWVPLMKAGNVSFIVQSGMLSAGFLMMILERGGMGISKACSIGNKCDVNETELLEYFINDERTEVIGCYLESIIDGRRFLELARGSDKPIVVLKGGRSDVGTRAVMSHTASMSGSDAVYTGAFMQAGIVQVYDLYELMDVVRGFSKTKSYTPRSGTAVMTFSGGAAIVTTDLLADCGINLAELSSETLAALAKLFPAWAKPANPLDLWPAVEAGDAYTVYTASVKALFADPAVDSIIIEAFAFGFNGSDFFSIIRELMNKYGKPIAVWAIGLGPNLSAFRTAVEDAGLPVFSEIKRCAEFFAGVRRHFIKKEKLREYSR
jgi:acyl-CoA synthetase (NDP forming)